MIQNIKILSLLLVISTNSAFGKELIPQKGLEGKLSKYWAQELVGADLIREEINKHNIQMRKVKVATLEYVDLLSFPEAKLSKHLKKCMKSNSKMCQQYLLTQEDRIKKESRDIQYAHHGTLMMNLAIGYEDVSIGVAGELVAMNTKKNDDAGVAKNLKKYRPEIICSSNGPLFNMAKFEEMLTHFKDNEKVFFSFANGNSYPHNMTNRVYPEISFLSESLSPTGFISEFSESSPYTAAFAPSDRYVMSRSRVDSESTQTSLVQFGGTSGAQPITCGSMVNVLSLLEGITRKEMRHLMRQTSLSFSMMPKTTEEGIIGIVNAYKMFRVALRLSEKWPRNRSEIYTEDLYDFSQEVALLEKNENKTLDINEKVKIQRKMNLLTPRKKDYAKKIANSYREIGLLGNSTLFNNLALSRDEITIEHLSKTLALNEDLIWYKSIFRAAVELGEDFYSFIDDFFENDQALMDFYFIDVALLSEIITPQEATSYFKEIAEDTSRELKQRDTAIGRLFFIQEVHLNKPIFDQISKIYFSLIDSCMDFKEVFLKIECLTGGLFLMDEKVYDQTLPRILYFFRNSSEEEREMIFKNKLAFMVKSRFRNRATHDAFEILINEPIFTENEREIVLNALSKDTAY